MQDDLNSRSSRYDPYATPQEGYPHDRFVLLLIFLVILIGLVAVVQFAPSPVPDREAFMESELEGDIAAKIAYAYERWTEGLVAEPEQIEQLEAFRDRQIQAARSAYRRTVEQAPTPDNVRRLMILAIAEDRPNAIEQLADTGRQFEIPEDQLQGEISMWQHIYVSEDPITPDQVQTYQSRIEDMGLRWYEDLALADLFERAEMIEQAQARHASAAESASRTTIQLLVLLATMAVLGIVGILVIIWYVNARKTGKLTAPEKPNIEEPTRSLVAGYMLESFVVYMAAVIVTQFGAGILMAAEAINAESLDAEFTIYATAGSYVLGGVLAVLYLSYRLRSAGWSWSVIGWKSERPLADIGWGIAGYAAALPLLVAAGLITQVLGRYVRTPPNPVVPLFAQAEELIPQMIIFGLVLLAAPLFEELFFRGVLFTSFYAKWGARLGIILSAAAFAAVHPLPLGFIPIFVLGYILATLLHLRRSLLPAIVAHALNNGASFTILWIMVG